MQTIAGSFLLAVASGLAFLAVKHPAIYEKLFNKLYLVIFVIYVAVAAWSGGAFAAFKAITPFIQLDKLDAASTAVDAVTIHVGWAAGSMIGSFVYLLFLSWLASQILADKPSKDE